MKKLIILAIIATLFASCKKNDPQPVIPIKVATTFNLTIMFQPMTTTGYMISSNVYINGVKKLNNFVYHKMDGNYYFNNTWLDTVNVVKDGDIIKFDINYTDNWGAYINLTIFNNTSTMFLENQSTAPANMIIDSIPNTQYTYKIHFHDSVYSFIKQ